MGDLLAFSWPVHRAGYELRRSEEIDREIPETIMPPVVPALNLWVVPIGGSHSAHSKTMSRLVDYREPLNLGISLFRNFVDWEATAEGVLHFTEAYGFLFKNNYDDPQGIEVDAWLYRQAAMRASVSHWQENVDVEFLASEFNRAELGPLTTKLQANTGGTSVSLVLQPQSLWALMWLEIARHVSNKSKLRQCEWCGKWFHYGTGTGRRKTAIYCSDPCRKANHLKSKREA